MTNVAGAAGSAYAGGMDAELPPPPEDDARARRNRLVGRALIIGVGLLALAQILPMLLRS